MPHEISIDTERRLAVLRMWGEITSFEIRGTVDEALADPRYVNAMHLVDLREVTSVSALRVEDIRAVAAGRLPLASKLVIVASDSAAFGLARMFSALHAIKDSRLPIGVFRTLEEAQDWLGL